MQYKANEVASNWTCKCLLVMAPGDALVRCAAGAKVCFK